MYKELVYCRIGSDITCDKLPPKKIPIQGSKEGAYEVLAIGFKDYKDIIGIWHEEPPLVAELGSYNISTYVRKYENDVYMIQYWNHYHGNPTIRCCIPDAVIVYKLTVPEGLEWIFDTQ
jgi:hypothetical protein